MISRTGLLCLRAGARPSVQGAAAGRMGLLGARGVATKKEDVVKHLKKAGIISDVIPSLEPTVQLSARFLSSGEEAAFGNSIVPVDAQGKPAIELLPFPGEDGIAKELQGKTAFVVMTDPDAPSHDNPEWAEFCHWIHKIQLPTRKEGGEVIHNAGKQTSEEIVPYASPAPPKDTGKHRYVLLVLEGGKDGKDVKGPSEDQRKKWGNEKAGTSVQKWAEENGLTPIGANYFYAEAQKEQSVDEINHDKRGLAAGSGYGG